MFLYAASYDEALQRVRELVAVVLLEEATKRFPLQRAVRLDKHELDSRSRSTGGGSKDVAVRWGRFRQSDR